MKRAASWSPDRDEDDSEESEDSESGEASSDWDEDGRGPLICQETLADTGAYKFAIQLRKHSECKKAVISLSVGILHRESEVGSLEGLVIDRDIRPRWSFHEICDAESQELQAIGFFFCNDDGRVRYSDIDGLSEEEDYSASSGGFLHIDMIKINEEHRHGDVGVRCIKAVLEWLNARDTRERQERSLAHERARPPPNCHMRAFWKWRFADAERKCLHPGWTLVVLTAALEATQEYRLAMSRPNPEPGTPEHAVELARKLRHEAALRKVTLQWARLGFQQASFGSEFWYLTPSRLGLKTKQEVADAQVTKIPEPRPLDVADKPLAKYFQQCGKDGLPTTWEADVRGHVAQGADLTRMHALQYAVLNGATSDAQLRLLVGLRADPNGQDAAGCTALHLTARLLGKGEATEASAVTAAKTLLALGASRSVVDVRGQKPLDTVLKKIRFLDDLDGALSVSEIRAHRGTWCDEEVHGFALAIELLEPPQFAALFEGVLTPRQRHRVEWHAEIRGDEAKSLPRFQNRVPRRSKDMWEVPYWEYIPREVRGERVFKSFVEGWASVLWAISELISPSPGQNRRPRLPTVEAVTELSGGYDDRYVAHFLQKGGKVEFALDALIRDAARSEDFFGDWDDEKEAEYEALPVHPFDEQWGFVRYKLLGARGKVPKGPY